MEWVLIAVQSARNARARERLRRTTNFLFGSGTYGPMYGARVDFVNYGPPCHDSVVCAAPLNFRDVECRLDDLGETVCCYGLMLILDGRVREFLPHSSLY